ncbi:uncharacterized protein LY89DRAFT_777949 [Mollisia scopiformis]|uniref:N-acetyltransferase domain-containing protein n=1 Tax=Mollisia scopiformis TaxID=149040 RepID=A0A194XN18_MOLSC|nr:uncharacterized protein LY89DRAFT_777949 [Mollisia scopiformis]KUJ21521.1 hypothetical protein LY89DRAFT_777949 [Mollisia scopiformis]
MAFAIHEASVDDAEDLARIYVACHIDDDVWKILTANVKHQDHVEWVANNSRAQYHLPERKVYKVIDTATGKIVAYATLTSPYPSSEEERATSASTAGKSLPPGINEGLMKEFFGMLSSTKAYGYDPDKHFHRKGTMVLPEYQRKGLGTMLNAHCNDLADKAKAATYVAARPNSLPMLQKSGFKILADEKIDMTKYGGSREDGKAWALIREPQ